MAKLYPYTEDKEVFSLNKTINSKHHLPLLNYFHQLNALSRWLEHVEFYYTEITRFSNLGLYSSPLLSNEFVFYALESFVSEVLPSS